MHVAAFCNVAQPPLSIQPGGVHLAVGFVDLGELAATVAQWQKDGATVQNCQLQCLGLDCTA